MEQVSTICKQEATLTHTTHSRMSRAIARLAFPGARAASSALRASAAPSLRLGAAARPVAAASQRLFSASAARLASAADKDLVKKLQEEVAYELEENANGGKTPEFVEAFQKEGGFKVRGEVS
jgi:hypothetical protein